MEILSYTALGAIIAAIITISSSWIANYKLLQRNRIVLLKKVLYSLIEVRDMLQYFKNIVFIYDSLDSLPKESKKLSLDEATKRSHRLKEKHDLVLETLSGEFPILATKIRWHIDCLDAFETYAAMKSNDYQEEFYFHGQAMSFESVLKTMEKNIPSAIQEVENSILTLSQQCDHQTHKETKEALERTKGEN